MKNSDEGQVFIGDKRVLEKWELEWIGKLDLIDFYKGKIVYYYSTLKAPLPHEDKKELSKFQKYFWKSLMVFCLTVLLTNHWMPQVKEFFGDFRYEDMFLQIEEIFVWAYSGLLIFLYISIIYAFMFLAHQKNMLKALHPNNLKIVFPKKSFWKKMSEYSKISGMILVFFVTQKWILLIAYIVMLILGFWMAKINRDNIKGDLANIDWILKIKNHY